MSRRWAADRHRDGQDRQDGNRRRLAGASRRARRGSNRPEDVGRPRSRPRSRRAGVDPLIRPDLRLGRPADDRLSRHVPRPACQADRRIGRAPRRAAKGSRPKPGRDADPCQSPRLLTRAKRAPDRQRARQGSGSRSRRLEQSQRLEAGHALAADHQVVVDIDLQRLAGLDDLLGHVDVGTRRCRVAGGMVVEQDDVAAR